MMDDYRNLPPERIPSMPGKEAAVERFMAMSDDRLSSQIFHVNFCYKSCSIFRYCILSIFLICLEFYLRGFLVCITDTCQINFCYSGRL